MCELGILVGFGHAAKHESIGIPTPSANTQPSHLPRGFSSVSGMDMPGVFFVFSNMFRKLVSADL